MDDNLRRMMETIYAEPLLEWTRTSGWVGKKDGIDHAEAMAALIECANRDCGACMHELRMAAGVEDGGDLPGSVRALREDVKRQRIEIEELKNGAMDCGHSVAAVNAEDGTCHLCDALKELKEVERELKAEPGLGAIVLKYRSQLGERDRKITDLRTEMKQQQGALWGARCIYCKATLFPDRLNQDITDEELRAHIEECPKHPMVAAEKEIRAVLELVGSDYVVCREGGGPEDIYGSLALTVARIQNRAENLRVENGRLTKSQAAALELSADWGVKWSAMKDGMLLQKRKLKNAKIRGDLAMAAQSGAIKRAENAERDLVAVLHALQETFVALCPVCADEDPWWWAEEGSWWHGTDEGDREICGASEARSAHERLKPPTVPDAE